MNIYFDSLPSAFIFAISLLGVPVFASTPGAIVTVAGGGIGDGLPALQASLIQPGGLATDAKGDLFLIDNGRNRIRKVGLDGKIITVAGTGDAGFSGDGGPATAARLQNPVGIADTGNDRIRKVDYSVSRASLAPDQIKRADANGDGAVNIADVVKILRIAAHLDASS